MCAINDYVMLFDLDGVIMDTESQYPAFWDKKGAEYLGDPHFCSKIKGSTLGQILDHFPSDNNLHKQLEKELTDFEKSMDYRYIPGARELLIDLHDKGIRTAIVTSSNDSKMSSVYAGCPEIKQMVNYIITANMFTHSKPNPECFLAGMKLFGVDGSHTLVFEDSYNGLNAGRAAGAIVIGLSTTNPKEEVAKLCDVMIDDFKGIDVQWISNTIDSLKK